ncbi:MAG: beta(1,3)galactosyltransferase EpsH [Clostridia bacterium]|nr:beta(1,3)galactosyltransferase EpsH [Clostridia bacterium]
MIFITLGSQKFQFDRLLRAVDELIAAGRITEPVFAQAGYSTYVPKHFTFETFMDGDSFSRHIAEADVVIAHAGTGAIIRAVKMGKRVIVVPRLKKYGEHVDDHQTQIAELFSSAGMIVRCDDCSVLDEKLREVRELEIKPYVSNTDAYISFITDFLESR